MIHVDDAFHAHKAFESEDAVILLPAAGAKPLHFAEKKLANGFRFWIVYEMSGVQRKGQIKYKKREVRLTPPEGTK